MSEIGYQSYQSGIETLPCVRPPPALYFYQSYQSGIETSTMSGTIEISDPYQSYQSGIETQFQFCLQFRKRLSIVPKWNWNFITAGTTAQYWSYQSYQSGIETVQFKGKSMRMWLSIVPKWNWNKLRRWRQRTIPGTINRTKVELKLRMAIGLSKALRTINRTKVELKHVISQVTVNDNGYQSYQSGIETLLLWLSKKGFLNYQSYQSGIETLQASALSKQRRLYQSYQSGIETNIAEVERLQV